MSLLTTLRFGPIQPLAQASRAPQRAGIYRLIRNGQLVYVGQTGNLRRRLMEHLLCLRHLRISHARYSFRYVEGPRSTAESRRQVERRIIQFHQQRGRLTHQREFEAMLTAAANELECSVL